MTRAVPLPLEAVLERALSLACAPDVEVSLQGTREGVTRFANNAITQNVARDRRELTVRVAFDARVGSATVTDLSEEGVRACVERAEEIARVTPPDPEYLPPVPHQCYPLVQGRDEATSQAGPEDRAARIREVLEVARAGDLVVAGSVTSELAHLAVASSAGVRFYQELTRAEMVTTAMRGAVSGWAQSASHRLSDLDARSTAGRAVEKVLLDPEPSNAEPGEYTVVLEPAATADFFACFHHALDARAASEGRSAFSGLEGTRIGVDQVTMSSDPAHSTTPVFAATSDGLARPKVNWIRNGVLETLSYDRYWAGTSGKAYTGAPANLIIRPGHQELDELIQGVDRGLLVTRFWYIRYVDPMKLLLTGMTRDGLFRIEHGRVTHAVTNLRFNDSPLECLKRIEAIGTAARSGRYAPFHAPAMRIEGLNFTSGTSF